MHVVCVYIELTGYVSLIGNITGLKKHQFYLYDMIIAKFFHAKRT